MPRSSRWLSAFLLFMGTGCAPLLQTMAAAAEAQQSAQASSLAAGTGSTKLMLFGGQGHKTYLGCINCGQFARDGIENTYSEYGSAYSATSIFNHYSDFGSKYSAYSACNPYASDPPVIVDPGGGVHGRLTLNAYAPGAITDAKVRAWLTAICG